MILLPYPVSANRYWRNFRGRQVVSAEARAYKKHIAWLWASSKLGIIDQANVKVRIELLPKLTKNGAVSRVCMDLDNSIKITLDALNKIAYRDDSQIVEIIARYGLAVTDGGVMVEVEMVEQ